MLDSLPDLSICPEASTGFPGQPGLVARHANGTPTRPALRLRSRRGNRRPPSPCATATPPTASPTALISHSTPTPACSQPGPPSTPKPPVFLDWLAAPVLPAPQLSDVLIDFAGRWCGEFQPQTTPWTAGIRKRDNRTGRSGHEHFPGLVVPLRGATNTRGTACAFHYGWSGGHGMLAEELPDGRRQIQFGHAAGSESAPGRHFATARLFATWSDTGLNGCAVAFQRHLRERIVAFPDPAQPAPGPLQLLGSGLFRPRPRRPHRHRQPCRPVSAPSVSCSTTAGSAGATTTPPRSATGGWTAANIPTASPR